MKNMVAGKGEQPEHIDSEILTLTLFEWAGFHEQNEYWCEIKASGMVEDPWVGKIPWEGNGNPLQYSCLENPMDGEAW